ncbi:MAG TPA: YHS domain-containing (seleno)protein [Pelomicrobium sp.]|nr:YHS domain-containing (seleno)protein [Pelomicrobium sp.]
MIRAPASVIRLAAAWLLSALVLTIPATALAEPAAHVNVQKGGVAVHGYDPVAYFTAGKPTPGKPEFTAVHEGATYRFATAENLAAFKADPARYAPQYGGWCAYGVAKGGKFDIDPQVWKVVDGKLYLNFNASVGRTWSGDIPGYLKRSEAEWPKIKDTPADKL